jgi:hypothetical protein
MVNGPKKQRAAVEAPRRPRQARPRLHAAAIAAGLQRRLGDGDPVVLWEEGGSRVLVHVRDLRVNVRERGLVVTVPLETLETGRRQVTVALALAHGNETPDAVVMTDDLPAGDRRLVEHWGRTVQEAVFAALVELLHEAARDADARPRGFRVRDGRLELALDAGSSNDA